MSRSKRNSIIDPNLSKSLDSLGGSEKVNSRNKRRITNVDPNVKIADITRPTRVYPKKSVPNRSEVFNFQCEGELKTSTTADDEKSCKAVPLITNYMSNGKPSLIVLLNSWFIQVYKGLIMKALRRRRGCIVNYMAAMTSMWPLIRLALKRLFPTLPMTD